MKIPGYAYITHKLIQRPWGLECRFTVARPDGTHINDIAMISDAKTDIDALAESVSARLSIVDAPREPDIVAAPLPQPEEVLRFLQHEGYLKENETLAHLLPITERAEE